MNEEWRQIDGFPDYAVSSHGRVRRLVESKKGSMPKVLRPHVNNKGYAIITLFGPDGRGRRLQISRLVCTAFHGPPPSPGHQAAHNNGDPSVNFKDNLRWATRVENMADCLVHGTRATGKRHGRYTKPERNPRGSKHGLAKLTEEDVLRIRQTPKTYGSGRKLAAEFGISSAAICLIRARKNWKHI